MDLPDDNYEALSFRAASEHRSLIQQALAEELLAELLVSVGVTAAP
jgi:hypothetical protein